MRFFAPAASRSETFAIWDQLQSPQAGRDAQNECVGMIDGDQHVINRKLNRLMWGVGHT